VSYWDVTETEESHNRLLLPEIVEGDWQRAAESTNRNDSISHEKLICTP